MSWRTDDSRVGAHVWDSEPLGIEDLACRDEELTWLKKHEQRSWGLMNGRIAQKGDPVAMAEGTYGGLLAYPPAQSLGAITGGTAIVNWWTPGTYTPIPANGVLAPDAYRLAATGIFTVVSGTVIPNASITSGTVATPGLGAGPTWTPTAVTAGLWYLLADVTVRTAGTLGTAYGMFELKVTTAAGPAATTVTVIYGNTAQSSIDFTAAQGLAIGATPSVSTTSFTPTQIHWMSWN